MPTTQVSAELRKVVMTVRRMRPAYGAMTLDDVSLVIKTAVLTDNVSTTTLRPAEKNDAAYIPHAISVYTMTLVIGARMGTFVHTLKT